MPHRRRLASLAVLAALVALVAPTAASARPIVLELFTSQGCSSCPPAEALLVEYAARPDLLPLSFHVTYWDRLGWKDPLALPEATQRQETYAGRAGSSAFTPQLVVDGVHSVVGSRREEAGAAIARAAAQKGAAASVTLGPQGANLSIVVEAGAGAANVLLVGFDHLRRTAIGRGENSGRTIVQANVVRSVRSLARWDGQPLGLSVPRPAGEDFAVILQGPDGRIVGAARLGRPGAG